MGVERLEVHVTVARGAATAARSPCEPGVGDPEGLTSIADRTNINDGQRSWVVVGGARIPYPINAGPLGKTLPSDEIMSIGSIPRDGTKLAVDGETWMIVARSLVQVGAARDAVTVPVGSLDGIPIYRLGVAFTNGTLVRDSHTRVVWRYLDNRWAPAPGVCSRASVVQLADTIRVPPR
jgi:hypothetical protein